MNALARTRHEEHGIARTAADLKMLVSPADVLRHHGCTPDAHGRWRCPFPERHTRGDEHPSVTIKEGRASCWSQSCFRGADVFELIRLLEGLQTFPEQQRRIEALAGLIHANGKGNRRIVATYNYVNSEGGLLFQVVRFEPKDFRQRRPDGNDGWVWDLKGIQPVLYRLPEVLKADSVLVLEGEKDVETAYRCDLPPGWTATCNPMGAGKWSEEFSDCLTGKSVVILPDADERGRQHGQQVAKSVSGKAAAVYMLSLPHGKDLTEWAESGKTSEDFRALLATGVRWRADDGPMPFTALGDLLNEPEDTRPWVLDGRLPAGGLSLIAGKPKAGKSTLARCLALAVARGESFLGFATTQGPVLYLALEEKRAEVRRHFRDMGATAKDQIYIFCAPSPTDGLSLLRQAAERYRPILIIVDPLFRFTRVKDANDYAAVTAALEPLGILARDSGAGTLAVHHMGKGDREGGDAILGSTAIFAAVDTGLLLKRTDKYRTLSSVQRYGEDLAEMTIAWDSAARTMLAGPSREEADQAAAGNAILEYLGTLKEPVEEQPILEQVEGRRALKVKALRALVQDGQITKTGKGGKADPFKYALPVKPREHESQPEHGNKNADRPALAPSPPGDSCSLVPTYIREQENKNRKSDLTPRQFNQDSSSHDSGLYVSQWEQESSTQEHKSPVSEVIDLDD